MKYLLIFLVLFFSACSVKQLEKSSKMVVFKTKNIRFSDLGYIGEGKESVEIDLYVVGKAFKKISIDGMICIEGEGCMRKSSFNEEYLSSSYPDDLLKNVFLGKPIFEQKNLLRTDIGFVQIIQSNGVDIVYKVELNEIYFKDRKNKILIRIKDVK
ncbi:hypothetical protein [Sulfurimonas marina]|uniref:Lipoprotein n=1 Tax=Sulfurimonas marina TaxID=2590551 RepID=A0A7M1AWZ5_9BACT|nr:hypothetical protein [Sulfurimonas marina]QOP41981.1 hypothetical protein FJR03_09625 [Sulfurimonas marina]